MRGCAPSLDSSALRIAGALTTISALSCAIAGICGTKPATATSAAPARIERDILTTFQTNAPPSHAETPRTTCPVRASAGAWLFRAGKRMGPRAARSGDVEAKKIYLSIAPARCASPPATDRRENRRMLHFGDFDLAALLPFIAVGFAAQLVDGALGMAFGVISNTL